MNHGPSQEQEVGLYVSHTFQIVSHSSFAIYVIQTPVGVRTYAVLCCIGDQVRFDRKVCPHLRSSWPWNVASCVGALPGSPSSGGDPWQAAHLHWQDYRSQWYWLILLVFFRPLISQKVVQYYILCHLTKSHLGVPMAIDWPTGRLILVKQ